MGQTADKLHGRHRIADIGFSKRLSGVIFCSRIDRDHNAVSAESRTVGTGQLQDASVIHRIIGGADFGIFKQNIHGDRLTVLGDCHKSRHLCDIHVLTEYYADLIGCRACGKDRRRSGGGHGNVDVQLGRRHGEPAICICRRIVFTVGGEIAFLFHLDQPVADGRHPCKPSVHVGDLRIDLAVVLGLAPIDFYAVIAFFIDLCCGTFDAVGGNGFIDIASRVDGGVGFDGILGFFANTQTVTITGDAVMTVIFIAAITVIIVVIAVTVSDARILRSFQTGTFYFRLQFRYFLKGIIELFQCKPFRTAASNSNTKADDNALRSLQSKTCRNGSKFTDNLTVFYIKQVFVPVLGFSDCIHKLPVCFTAFIPLCVIRVSPRTGRSEGLLHAICLFLRKLKPVIILNAGVKGLGCIFDRYDEA